MKRVKLMSVALMVLSMVAVTSVNAQPQQREPKSAEDVAKMTTLRMAKCLELTEAQSSKIYDINLEYAKEREARMKVLRANREKRRDECVAANDCPRKGCEYRRPMRKGGNDVMMANRYAKTKAVISVLTDDQIVKYIEMRGRTQYRPQHGRRGCAPRCNRRGCI